MNNSPGGKTYAEGKSLLRRTSTRAAAAVAAGTLVLAGGGVAYADAIANTLDASVDSVAETMTLNLGGSNGTTLLYVVKLPDHGTNGCTIQGREAVTLSLVSSDPAVAAVSPATATFDSCDATATVTVTPKGIGTTNILASLTANNTGEPYDVSPVNFGVTVVAPAPSNTAPVLGISGVTPGGSYIKGFVPQAMCEVSDAEEGNSSFPAKLSLITGPDAAGGVGSQEASCYHEDGGGLTASGSVTYGITDGTAPTIGYTLSPAAPNGLADWYTSDVTLDWTVTEGDSPSTLVLTGCEDRTITADQVATDYSCAATSNGGSADPVTLSLKKDGTAPTVGYGDKAAGTLGTNGWYTSDVEATFTATDATSGLLTSTKTATSNGEGSNVAVLSPVFTDIAGNTAAEGTASRTFKIDKTAPTVTYVSTSPEAGTDSWYNADVTATFSATDLVSGPLEATKQVTSSGEGAAVVVGSPAFEDVAGNITPAGAATQSYKIDKTAPSVSFDSLLGESYYGSTPAAPTCTASDALSGVNGNCSVTGYSTSVGAHTLVAEATDLAGNTTSVTQNYEIKAWTLKGFYQPVDMGGVLNTVKGGSTVPAKFEIFAGHQEVTDLTAVSSLKSAQIQCSLLELQDAIEATATGSTSLRYDSVAGQFVYNWKTPIGAGTCYKLTMTAKDGSSISANFKLK